ncbi:hypothetical protein ID866_10163 [Astraeus odoratus]|nr:hypothetical protein ID866_10163 [Astraeus odoratus]
MATLWKKVKEDCMKERTAERRQKCEEEKRICVEAECREQEAAEQKEEEEEAWRAKEAKKEGGQHAGAPVVHFRGPGLLVTGVWSKTAGGVTWKWRRTEDKEDNGEDNKKDNEDDSEGDFTVLPALVQEHRDVFGALTTTLSTLLKEFKGYCCDQWDLQACQVRRLKALQKEMKKANTLKAKELEATTKGKEKAAEVLEESLESGKGEEEVKDSCKGGVAKGGDGDGDRDIEMGAAPSASVM